MSRTTRARGIVALAVGAAAVIAAGVPALADPAATETHRAVPPAVTIDFTGTNSAGGAANAIGAGFGGTATVKDATGAQVATVYDQCTKDAVSVDSVTAFCAADLVFTGGDQITFTVDAVRSYPKSAFPAEEVYAPTGRAELRVITCGGHYDRRTGYDSNTVVFAHLSATA